MLKHRDEPAVKPLFELAFAKRPAEELYDLRHDPDQLHKVANDPRYTGAKARLAESLVSELKATRDPRVLGMGGSFDGYPYCWGPNAPGRVLGANDTIRIGVAGIHGQGSAHIDQYLEFKNVQVTHLIDPDRSLHESRSAKIRDKGGNQPKCFQDIRRALDDPNLDAISIAAPNHWHSLLTIWACQAGKDVYVEKPLSHNVVEGRRCIEAVRKYGRMVQHGTQFPTAWEPGRPSATRRSVSSTTAKSARRSPISRTTWPG